MSNNTVNIIYNTFQNKILGTKISEIKNHNFVNWELNRPADDLRVNDILKYYIENKINIVPGMINIWHFNNEYRIYDGLHRFLAAKNNYLNDMYIIMNIKYTDNELDIIEEFNNINKSVNVPSIYLDDIKDLNKKNICQNIVARLCNAYPQFSSPSRRPLKPNYNRDTFLELICSLDINFNDPNIEDKVYNLLLIQNQQVKKLKLKNKLSYLKKCITYDFWLFYLDHYCIKSYIEKNYN